MKILGIDTSGKVAAVALYDSETEIFLSTQTIYTQKTHSQVIIPLVERMLQDCGVTLQEIEAIAVAKGPGSYTGLRIGISVGKSMSYALQTKSAAISTLEALAWQNLSHVGYIIPVMSARTGFVYSSVYQSDGTTLTVVESDKLMEQAQFQDMLNSIQGDILLVGDGAKQEYHLPIASPNNRLQNATGLCLCAAKTQPWIPAEQMLPEYLQLVKAEKDRLDKLK